MYACVQHHHPSTPPLRMSQPDDHLLEEDFVIPSSVPGPSNEIENFSSQLFTRLGIHSHQEAKAETATFNNNNANTSDNRFFSAAYRS